MFNESLFSASFNELSNIITNELSLYNIALGYVLLFVIYRTLGRYIFFKPGEHESKINRTFLATSLLIVGLHFLSIVTPLIPIVKEHSWLFMISVLVILIAPFSIVMERIVWKYNKSGGRWPRYENYLPIKEDHFKSPITKEEQRGNYSHSWLEDGFSTTRANLHSDSLLHTASLLVFTITLNSWAVASIETFGYQSLFLSATITVFVSAVFIDRSVFSWITFTEDWLKRRSKR